MADIRNLIERVLSGSGNSGNGGFSSRVYRDEPILMTASQLESRVPSEYRRMRRIARECGGFYYESSAKIFYEQGKFMEDFEDDFDYSGEFVQYFPTYQTMNDSQLRGYFSWRAKVRRGLLEETQLSFAFVYIYELLNRIGVKSPEEGFYKLKNFRDEYGRIDSRINRYADLWLKDYVIYYNLDKSLLDGLPDTDFDNTVLMLLDYKSRGAEEVFSALNSLSSYDFGGSRFFKEYREDVRAVVYAVFSAVSGYCAKNRKNTVYEKFFGRIYPNPYQMFRSAVFYQDGVKKDFVYRINDIHGYRCKKGLWSCERFFYYGGKNRKIGAILKTVDFLMRQKYCFKSALKPAEIPKVFQDIINREINNYLENKKKEASLKIDIDVSVLSGIRDAALETQNKLIVEEPEKTDGPETPSEKADTGNSSILNGEECEFMRLLLYGGDYAGWARSGGLMISVIADAVNEKLFEIFGDIVIEDGGNGLELIEDYINELKGMIKE